MCDTLSRSQSRAAVIGIGQYLAGDDAAGKLVAQEVSGHRVLLLEPDELLSHLEDLDVAVIVDAAVGVEVGQVDVWTVDDILNRVFPHSRLTHGYGIADALSLGNAMDKLPKYVRLVTIGVGSVTMGSAPSPEVLAAVPRAVRRVEALLDSAIYGDSA